MNIFKLAIPELTNLNTISVILTYLNNINDFAVGLNLMFNNTSFHIIHDYLVNILYCIIKLSRSLIKFTNPIFHKQLHPQFNIYT